MDNNNNLVDFCKRYKLKFTAIQINMDTRIPAVDGKFKKNVMGTSTGWQEATFNQLLDEYNNFCDKGVREYITKDGVRKYITMEQVNYLSIVLDNTIFCLDIDTKEGEEFIKNYDPTLLNTAKTKSFNYQELNRPFACHYYFKREKNGNIFETKNKKGYGFDLLSNSQVFERIDSVLNEDDIMVITDERLKALYNITADNGYNNITNNNEVSISYTNNNKPKDANYDTVKELIEIINKNYAEDYQTWLSISSAIYNTFGQNGYELFKLFSSKSFIHNDEDDHYSEDKYKNLYQYHLLEKVKIGSIYYYAKISNPDAYSKIIKSKKIDITNWTASNFVEYHKNSDLDNRLVYTNKKWYLLNDKTNMWKEVLGGVVNLFVQINKEIISNQYASVCYINDEKERKNRTKTLEGLTKMVDNGAFSKHFINQMISAFYDDSIFLKFDNLPNKLVFSNGILDLTNKNFQIGFKPEDYITKTLDFPYNPILINEETKNILYNKIKEIYNDDDILTKFALLAFGYTLTGLNCEKAIFCQVGQRADNGKSTICEAITKCMPMYSLEVPKDVWLNTYRNSHKFLLDLFNKRLLWSDELPKGKSLNVELLKKITGKTYKCEVLFGTNVEIPLLCTLWTNTNYTPTFANDNGMLSRYKQLDLNNKFWEASEYYKLKDEGAILSNDKIRDTNIQEFFYKNRLEFIDLLADYAMKYNNEGLSIPENIQEASAETCKSNNFDNDILKNIYVRDVNGAVSKAKLLSRVKQYCAFNNIGVVFTDKIIIDVMLRENFKYDRKKMMNGETGIFYGLKLIDTITDKIYDDDPLETNL